MISDERIEEIVANHKRMDVLSLHHIRQAIKQALSEAEPLYRADERRKFADWLENGKTLYTQIRKRLANQLRALSDFPDVGDGWIDVNYRLPESWVTVIVDGGIAFYNSKEKAWYTLTEMADMAAEVLAKNTTTQDEQEQL